MKKADGWIIGVIIGAIVALVLVSGSIYIYTNNDDDTSLKLQSARMPVPINYENFDEVMPLQGFVQDLPANGRVVIRFYNYDSGEREIERSYILSKGSVKEGEDGNVDAEININSKYIQEMTDQNICSVMTEARNNGDMSLEPKMSVTAMAWKYRGMTKYKDCLGL